jgi:8-oxo-dGTP diphosphatase
MQVAAAVLVRGDGQVLLAQRPAGKAYAGYWEFPGGKVEAGESTRDALVRELREELGIVVQQAHPWLVQEFVYPHAHVELHFFRVFAWTGEIVGHDGQAWAWQLPGQWTVGPLLPANTRILDALCLPPVYGITNAGDVGEDVFIARLQRALERGMRLVAIRERDWPAARRAAFAQRAVAMAHAAGARVLLNGDVDEARHAGCDGVHCTAAALARLTRRPDVQLAAASCHTRGEIDRAAKLGFDFVVFGPVRATATHPDAQALGWEAFGAHIAGARIPVYALGGLAEDDLAMAIRYGAHGVALRSACWT